MEAISEENNITPLDFDKLYDVSLEIIWGILHIVVGSLAVGMNAFVLFIYRRMNMRSMVKTLFVGMTSTDIVSGIPAFYSGYYMLSGRPYAGSETGGYVPCVLFGIMFNWMSITTPLYVALCSFCRLYGILYPIRYGQVITRKKVLYAGIGFCVYGLLVAVSPYFIHGGYYFYQAWTICDYFIQIDTMSYLGIFLYDNFTMVLPVFVPVLIMISSNAVIIHSFLTSTPRTQSNANNGGFATGILLNRNVKAGLRIMLLTLNYFTCYGLWLFYYMSILLDDLRIVSYHFEMHGKVWNYLLTWYSFAAYLNAVLTPLIHWYTTAGFKTAVNNTGIFQRLLAKPNDSRATRQRYGTTNINRFNKGSSDGAMRSPLTTSVRWQASSKNLCFSSPLHRT